MASAQNAPQPLSNTVDALESGVRQQLQGRRDRLQRVAHRAGTAEVQRLLDEVDGALARLEKGTLGLCEVCHESVEPERLIADPMTRFCLDHLPPDQQRALEADLELAAELQARLLPDKNLRADGWSLAYEYRPAGLVSGDYCDLLVSPETGALYFALGDVSGKGVAASLLMSNLSAMFRALAPLAASSLSDLMAHANRVFCQSTLPNQYATLVLGRATREGEVEICNAGHLEPMLFRLGGQVESLDGASAPIGLFHQQTFPSTRVQLSPGDTLVLYSDGISEARNARDEEYGSERLADLFRLCAALTPASAVTACIRDLVDFRGNARQADDQALLVLQRTA